MVKSSLLQAARDNQAELHDFHSFESYAERLEFIDSLLADNKYPVLVAEHVEGGVHCPKSMQGESKAVNNWPASTLFLGRCDHAVYQHQMLSSAEYQRSASG